MYDSFVIKVKKDGDNELNVSIKGSKSEVYSGLRLIIEAITYLELKESNCIKEALDTIGENVGKVTVNAINKALLDYIAKE